MLNGIIGAVLSQFLVSADFEDNPISSACSVTEIGNDYAYYTSKIVNKTIKNATFCRFLCCSCILATVCSTWTLCILLSCDQWLVDSTNILFSTCTSRVMTMLVASRRRYQSVGVNVYNILSVTMHERVRLFPHQYERISSFFSCFGLL